MCLECNGCGSGAFVAKNPVRLRGTDFCTSLAHFALSFVTQLNSLECTQIVRNAPKHEVRLQWLDRVVCCEKFWHDFMAQTFAPLRLVLHPVLLGNQTVPNAPKYYKTHQNMSLCPKGSIRCVRCEKLWRDFMARTFPPLRPVLH